MSKNYEDLVMKSIMDLFRGDAVKYFGIDKLIVSVARTELHHIQVQRNINDWVLLADDGSYLHLEFQSDYDKKDLARFMVSDAMLYYKEGRPVKTVVVYSADIQKTITALDAGSLQYNIDAFYMSKLDGDQIYQELVAKIKSKETLTRLDLMSIVFLPLMKNSVNTLTRIEQSVELSKEIDSSDEQLQIQAMLEMLAEKFVKDKEQLQRLKGLMSMGAIAEMIREDAIQEGRLEGKLEGRLEIARNALKEGVAIEFVKKITGLEESTIRDLQSEIAS